MTTETQDSQSVSEPSPPPITQEERVKIIKEQVDKMNFLVGKMDREIGYNFWKKYVASAFWSQISTPVNLIITFLTAITTAQAQNTDLIPQSLYSQLAITSLVITTLNTFFRPHAQFSTNTEFLQKWNDIGVQFENEYYNKAIVRLFNDEELKSIKEKIKRYETIQNDMNILRKSEGSNTVNFLTDLLFLLCYSTCLRNYKRWLDHDMKVENDQARKKKRQQQIESDEAIARERMKSYLKVEMAAIQLHEKRQLKEMKEEHRIRQPQRIFSQEQNVFDLFIPTPTNITPPQSPTPPPPPVQELPSSIIIGEANSELSSR